MSDNYIKGKGILVGEFNSDDIKNKIDKIKVEEKMNETGLKYTNSEIIKKKKDIVGIRLYVCNLDDMKI